ncbi:30S ribosomal protein S4 [Texas Phoenix palm phytoplasma]|uniref:Small ribosomal subunit protein uS4 n=1 Tax=Texas Phoenix palm phytoplasma TaxID=176709 RepID=A0ABS5BIX2_9MOLU|nr:30S ribosomal protein S4 [Texas Phoenix palm phytoplasma]MBP3059537.1 30S ribosomal protein S4 [Texas Phoenix palm phytoplasma]
MSSYTNPNWKVSRRLNYSLSGTEKEFKKLKNKINISSQQRKRKSKLSDYNIQLQEKQKVRFIYGISEKQFKKIFYSSAKLNGIHGKNFLICLESRLDNIVYRLNIARTRAQAKQLISHGHIMVDSKKVDIGSYCLKPGQQVSLKEKIQNSDIIKFNINENKKNNFKLKEYLAFDAKKLVGKYIRFPERNEFLSDINEQLIVEFYNR